MWYNHFKDDHSAVHTFTLYDSDNQRALSHPDLFTLSYFEVRKKNMDEKLKSALTMIREFHASLSKAIEATELPKELWDELITQLENQKIPYAQ